MGESKEESSVCDPADGMTRRTFLKGAAMTAAAVGAASMLPGGARVHAGARKGESNMGSRPNIIYFHVDNLGLGELGCYGGGKVRGAETKRIDQFAGEGMQIWHYVTEPQCSPSRSALMTGRHAIRSGTHTATMGGEEGGIVAWERTMAEVLSAAGYATACFGKWHIGAEQGRWPTDHGFDEWYGPPRSYDECLWPDDPWYDPQVAPAAYMLEGRKGEPVRELLDQQLTIHLKRDVDQEYKRRAFDFMRRSMVTGKAFFLYYNHPLMH